MGGAFGGEGGAAPAQQQRRRGQGRPRQTSRRISRQPVGGARSPARPPPPEMLRHFGLAEGEFFRLKREAEASAAAVRAVLADPAAAPEAKHDAQCRHHAQYGRALFACRGCWMQRQACRCADFAPGAPGHLAGLLPPHLSVIVHMHHLEFGRASNTGSVLVQSLGGALVPLEGCEEAREAAARAGGPGAGGEGAGAGGWGGGGARGGPPRAEVTLAGLVASERRLRELAADEGVVGAVLWPGEDSLLPSELRALAGSRPICVVALDATWASGNRLSKRMPDGLLRVRLPPPPADEWAAAGSQSLLAPLRRYRGASGENGRVSTLEAVAVLLEELGAPPELGEGLRESLRRHVDRVRVQGGRGTHYAPLRPAQPGRARGGSCGGGGGGGGGGSGGSGCGNSSRSAAF